MNRAGDLLRQSIGGAFALFRSWAPVPVGFYPTMESWRGSEFAQQYRQELLIHSAHPGETLVRDRPGFLGESLHPKFTCELQRQSPPTFVLEYHDGRCWGPSGTVLSPDNRVLAELSCEFRDSITEYTIFKQQRIRRPTRLSGTAILLAAPAGHVFGHFLFDVLPRLAVLERAGFDWRKVDHVLISGPYTGFQKEALDLLEIPAAKIVDCSVDAHYTADRLLVPSRPGISGNYPAWVVQYIRDLLMPFAGQVPPGLGSRLLVSRSLASGRRIANERALLDVLQPLGFSLVHNETLSIPETIAVYRQAEFVIGPMGSGMCSAVFCDSGTKVLETYPDSSVNVFTWAFGQHIPLEFCYLVGRSLPGSQHDHDKNYTICVEDMRNLVGQMNQSAAST